MITTVLYHHVDQVLRLSAVFREPALKDVEERVRWDVAAAIWPHRAWPKRVLLNPRHQLERPTQERGLAEVQGVGTGIRAGEDVRPLRAALHRMKKRQPLPKEVLVGFSCSIVVVAHTHNAGKSDVPVCGVNNSMKGFATCFGWNEATRHEGFVLTAPSQSLDFPDLRG